jgi:phospholipid/cholesterol/gamma-HCH transport system substrate-binding protein
MKNLSAELKVGIFAIIVIILLSFMTFKIGGLSSGWKKGYTLYVAFDNISGLDEKSKIKIAGVDAGTVEKIRLKDGKAELTLIVDPDVRVYKDAKASLRVSGLLGDKYLALKTGSALEALLNDGDRIENIEPAADIDALANELTTAASHVSDLASSMASLMDIFGVSEKEAISESIHNLKSVTADLRDILKEGKGPLKTTLTRIEDFSGTLQDKGPGLLADLSAAARELRGLIEENKPAVKQSVENLKTFSQSADKIAQKIEKGEGTLGKLLKDEKLYASLSEAAGGISKTFSTVDRLRTYMDFRTEYLTRGGDWKGYFNLTLQPRDDRYYLLGVVTDPAGSGEVTDTIVNGVKTTEEKIKRKLEFTAQFAKRIDDFALRVGMTENTFGFGADYLFFNDKAKASFDMWDFSASEAMADRAHMKVGLEYRVFKHIFITSGIDNLLNNSRRGVYVGGGLKFEDEDFKYIFGAVPKMPSN